MAEIIFIAMVIAAIVVIGIAWTFARSRNRRGLSWIARTRPIAMDLGKNERRNRSRTLDR